MSTSNNRRNAPRTNQRSVRQAVSAEEIQEWLDTLDVGSSGRVYVNGPQHPTAVLTVDFGSPLGGLHLTGDQVTELQARMKKFTREAYKHEVNVRFSADMSNGVFWTAVA